MLTTQQWRAVVYRGTILDSSGQDDGPVFTQYRHHAKGAIAALQKAGGGVAVAALYHSDPRVGDIDLRWGVTSDDPRSKGQGLAKIIRWYPEALNDLQGFISSLTVHQTHDGVIHLRDEKDKRAAVRLDWNGKTAHWLVTAYIRGKKGKSASAPRGFSAALDDTFGPDSATPNNAGVQILGFETGAVNGG